jgi:dTDP-4-amino-4,6-dideoxygalactose transaminase
VIFETEEELLENVKKLNAKNIFPRRYFYPSLNKLPYITNVNMGVSESVSSRILCLPLYFDLSDDIVISITDILNS